MSLYLIPDDANALVHVNGTDLAKGTAKVGPVWTQQGSVPFAATNGPIPSVGPFTSSNYFSLPGGNVLNFPSAEAWTGCIIFQPPSTGNAGLFTSDSGVVTGVMCWWRGDTSILQLDVDGGLVAGSSAIVFPNLAVAFFGRDAAGHMYLQLNGKSVAERGVTILNEETKIAILGNAGNNAFAGPLFEVLFSSNAPSGAAFTALYQQIVDNIAGLTPTPESDVANYLATEIPELTMGTNLFTGAVLPANVDGREGGVPGLSVFVTSTGGPPPMPYMGLVGSAGSFYYHGIQVSTRSAPSQQAQGIELARAIRDALHRATIPMAGGGSYPFCLVKESQPLYLGADQTNRHRWSTNLDLRSAGLP